MKFDIGYIVRWLEDKSVENRYIILATKVQELNLSYLESREGHFLIKDIDQLARKGLAVNNGFDYLICREERRDNGCSVLIGNFFSVKEDDICL